MDKNNDGLIPREDFIDGIMKTSKKIDVYPIINDLCKLISGVFCSENWKLRTSLMA
jgi:hypothetical protein